MGALGPHKGLVLEVGSHILAAGMGFHFADKCPGEPDPQVVLAAGNGAAAAAAVAGDSGHPAVPERGI